MRFFDYGVQCGVLFNLNIAIKKETKYISNLLIINVVTPVGFKPTTAGAEI